MTMNSIDVTPSPRLLQVLGDIPLAPWQCVAEFIDNSLDELARATNEYSKSRKLCVEISVENKPGGLSQLVIRDNGLGMSVEELEVALKAGATSKARYGTLGLFGMGFNIATARLGFATTVTTGRASDSHFLKATIDFAELQRRERFIVPLAAVPKGSSDQSGTEVRVSLKREMIDVFNAPRAQSLLRTQLGDVYSYLLREEVPGITKAGLSSPVQAEILVAGERVQPKLPCIWADSRTVQSYGSPVEAVQYIDTVLTEATACLACGYWDRSNGPTVCEECGSSRLEVRTRRIYGWLGIQRFIDASHFGIDFLRFGRKILWRDKSLFTYEDPDTLQSDVEYPIEMPANQGRIVGEVHLDHVPVTYQKNEFDRQHRDWHTAVGIIRGDQPLKPRGARAINNSPLARLFSAFRRNDPGLRYLTPGDGKRALHAKAKEWWGFFEKGIPRYQDDDEWYDAAKRHQELHDAGGAVTTTTPVGGATGAGTPATASASIVERLITGPASEPVANEVTTATPASAPLSRDDLLAEARAYASERGDLSGECVLGHNLGTWQIKILETSQPLVDTLGNDTPCTIGAMTGSTMEVLVNREHSIFTEYGRDIRDTALFQVADAVRSLSRTDLSSAVIYAMLVVGIEDLRMTPIALQEQARAVLMRVKQLMFDVIQESPETYWTELSVQEKAAVEEYAAVEYPNEPFEVIVSDGRFVLLLDGQTLAKLVEFAPLQFFDNRVFTAALSRRPEAGKKRQVQKIIDLLRGLHDFIEDSLARTADDLAMARIRVDVLARQLRSDSVVGL